MDQITEQKIRNRALDQASNEQHEDHHAQAWKLLTGAYE
jgi:hypothetical protein